ncbi:MAG: hypothetical protein B6U87_02890 [Candidatus Aenigmarchaeota archaeon ex4484_52]|nr:MAG: hypothetical protein B6U87_02890 [Candidatus Aenigmarchaeota archaeon ex4484_52]
MILDIKKGCFLVKWFVKKLGRTKQKENLSYVAGLLHDIVRHPTETICHAKLSAEKSREILKNFKVEETEINKIIQTIEFHRKKEIWTTRYISQLSCRQNFEQMGAYIVFRRCMDTE